MYISFVNQLVGSRYTSFEHNFLDLFSVLFFLCQWNYFRLISLIQEKVFRKLEAPTGTLLFYVKNSFVITELNSSCSNKSIRRQIIGTIYHNNYLYSLISLSSNVRCKGKLLSSNISLFINPLYKSPKQKANSNPKPRSG